jgi:hypothetical protein
MDVTKPHKFIGFGAMAVTKPYEFIGFGAMAVTKPYRFIGFGALHLLFSPELSHSLKVLGRRRNTLKLSQNPSESLCAGLWVRCQIFWVWFGPAFGPTPGGSRRLPAGSLSVFGALLAQRRYEGFNPVSIRFS